MHNSLLELSRKRVALNACESFKYFTKELLHKYLGKVFVISKLPFILAFPNVWLNFVKICCLNICCNLWGTKSGSWPCLSKLIWTNIPFFCWEIRPYFWTYGLKKRPNEHLNLWCNHRHQDHQDRQFLKTCKNIKISTEFA